MFRELPGRAQRLLGCHLAASFIRVGLFVGCLLGLGEGVVLFCHDVPLSEPLVGRGVLILAPLVDALAFGFLGGVLGGAAEFWYSTSPHRAWRLASIGLFIAGAYGTLFPAHVLVAGFAHARWVILILSVLGGLAVAITARLAWLSLEARPLTFAELIHPRLRRVMQASAGILAAALVGVVAPRIVLMASLPRSLEHNRWALGKRPNVVMIALDTGRADHFSAYGYARPTTPNLDNLAKSGVLFETAVAPFSWTLPSFATVFTGLLAHQVPVSYATPLADGTSTLASILNSRGYRTAGFNANFNLGTARTGLGQGFEFYNDDDESLRTDLAALSSVKVFWWLFYYPFIYPDYIARRDARQLNESTLHWFARDAGRPFFLFINYYDLHEPYYAAPVAGKQMGVARSTLVQRIRAEVDLLPLEIEVPRSPAEQAWLLAEYDGALSYTDRAIGSLLRLLEASPGWSNTYVIVFADHGQAFGEHRHYGHGWGLNWELLHVPLIIAGPGIPHGLRVPDVVGLQQLFATVLDLSEGGNPVRDRTSLRCFWTQPEAACDPSPLVISEHQGSPYTGDEDYSISAVTREWQLISDSAGNTELYHLTTDPREENNLAGTPEYQGEMTSLERSLVAKLQASPRPWLGEPYLAGLGESGFTLLTGKKFAALGLPEAVPHQPSTQDQEMLHSMPYH